TTIVLQAGAAATDGIYVGAWVTLLSGLGSGQTRTITAYDGASRTATVDSAWSVTPNGTSSYAVIPAAGSDTTSVPFPTVSQIAAGILKTPANLLVTDASGRVMAA